MAERSEPVTATGFAPDAARKLAERVRAACGTGANVSAIASLHGELEPRIQICNRLLRQLAEWASQGLVVEAASVDASFPGLCRSAHALMLGADQDRWDAACRNAGLPPTSRIGEDMLNAVSDAVADAGLLEDAVEPFQAACLAEAAPSVRLRALEGLREGARRNRGIEAFAAWYEGDMVQRIEERCRAAVAAGQRATLDEADRVLALVADTSEPVQQFRSWLRQARKQFDRIEANAAYAGIATRAVAAQAAAALGEVESACAAEEEVRRKYGVASPPEHAETFRIARAWRDSRYAVQHAGVRLQALSEQYRLGVEADAPADELDALETEMSKVAALAESDPPHDAFRRRAELQQARIIAGRRRRRITLALGIAAVATVVAASTLLQRTHARHVAADEAISNLAAIAGTERFAEAQQRLESMRQGTDEEAWILACATPDSVKQLQITCSESAARMLVRREEVDKWIDTARRRIESESIGDLQGQRRKLEQLLSSTGDFLRLTSRETTDAEELITKIDQLETKARTDADATRAASAGKVSEIFKELKRDQTKFITPESQRDQAERIDPAANKRYLKDVADLIRRIDELMKEPLVSDVDRIEMRSTLQALQLNKQRVEEVDKSLTRAQELERALAAATDPATIRAAADSLLKECGDILDMQDPAIRVGVEQTRTLADAAQALDEWNKLIVEVHGVPDDPNRADWLRSRMVKYLERFPRTPVVEQAKTLESLLNDVRYLPNGRTRSESIWDSLKKSAIADTAPHLHNVQQVRIEPKNPVAWPNQPGYPMYVFVKAGIGADDVDLKVFAGTVRTISDLRDGPPRNSIPNDLHRLASPTLSRDRVPFAELLRALWNQDGGSTPASRPAHLVRSSWLRVADEIRRMNDPSKTEVIATACLTLQMIDAFLQYAMPTETGARDASAKLISAMNGYAPLLSELSDWPRWSLRIPPEGDELRRKASEALRDLPDLGEVANALENWCKSSLEGCRAKRFAGVICREDSTGWRDIGPVAASRTDAWVIDMPPGAGEVPELRRVTVSAGKIAPGQLRASASAYVPLLKE